MKPTKLYSIVLGGLVVQMIALTLIAGSIDERLSVAVVLGFAIGATYMQAANILAAARLEEVAK